MNQQKYCRVCFESDQDKSSLISPCDCRGSSLYIHIHCLDQWQETALHSNLPDRATICPICKTRYRHPSRLFMLYRRLIHIVKYHVNITRALISLMWLSLFIIPLKIFIHTVLVVITLPFGSFSLNGASLTWIGYDFPPQLAIVHDSNGELVPSLRPGVLLVASTNIPATSIFHKAVVLVLEHSAEFGSKGVVINCISRNLKVSEYMVGSGGPMEQEICTVVHNSKVCSRYSYVLNEAEGIFVADCENAYPTLRQIAYVRNRQAKAGPTTRVEGEKGGTNGCSTDAPGTRSPEKAADVRVLRGTCAWIAHQLDGEVLAGRWHVVQGTPAAIFPVLPVQASSTSLGEENPGQSLYGNQRSRSSAHFCDTEHWQALYDTVSEEAH